MKKQVGFTLIELIIVIVILGILAAYAVPKYLTIDKEARVSVVKGLEGSIRAASDMVHSIALVKSTDGSGSVNIGGTTNIEIENYYAKPTTATNTGLILALSDTSGFNCSTSGTNFTCTKNGAGNIDACYASYSYEGTAGTTPTINSDTSGC